jgi:uncharacterized membrane protein YbhN (UPF0104 family)
MSELAMGKTPADSTAARRPKIKHALKVALAVAVIALAGALLYRTLSRYSYDEIVASMTAIPASRIALAMLFAGASYLCLTGFDWLALRYVGQKLPYPYVALTSFCSLSLGHNIGLAALSSGTVRRGRHRPHHRVLWLHGGPGPTHPRRPGQHPSQ